MGGCGMGRYQKDGQPRPREEEKKSGHNGDEQVFLCEYGWPIASQSKYVIAFHYRATDKSEADFATEAQKKMATPKMCPSPTQYLKDKDKLSYKRKREDLDSAGIRRPDNLVRQKRGEEWSGDVFRQTRTLSWLTIHKRKIEK
ncbi:hypothetical protein FQN60_017881 [Etheostoma spectabile]|uniref:Uncharacterized protein n=1 Tax=Etheostoma spectabile TaxID=54343 RepID=A0A5J5DGE4_9PERO|nr:hypothetical protein FQN60_017881 [Etheostoma spectabile]